MPQFLRKATRAALAAAMLATVPSPGAGDDAALGPGKAVFTTESEPSCAVCHALADAGATGDVGPDLDELKPTEEQVRAAVRGGVDVMPAYEETLGPEQIDAVAHYVAAVAGSGG